MENLEDLKRKYEEIGKEIKKRLENLRDRKTRCEFGEAYYYITAFGQVNKSIEFLVSTDEARFNFNNYFKTREEAKKQLEKITINNQLKNIADELNTENPINWDDDSQKKYSIIYDVFNKRLVNTGSSLYKTCEIFCTNSNFLDIAIERIGENNLKKLFT